MATIDPLRRLEELAARIARDTLSRDQAIRDARAAGCTWEKVATAAAMSRAGAIKAAARTGPR